MAERITDRISRLARLAAGRPPVLPGGPRTGAVRSEAESADYEYREPGFSEPAFREPAFREQRTRPSAPGPRGRTASFRSHVTARGALVGMFVVCLLGCLLAAWQGHDVLAALGYCAAAVLAPVYGRRDAQLTVVLSAPVIFLLADVVTQALTAQGGHGHSSVFSILEGTVLTLADVAPWLFAGTIACVIIALTRGLPECLRQLRSTTAGMTRLGPPDAVTRPAAARSEPPVRGARR